MLIVWLRCWHHRRSCLGVCWVSKVRCAHRTKDRTRQSTGPRCEKLYYVSDYVAIHPRPFHPRPFFCFFRRDPQGLGFQRQTGLYYFYPCDCGTLTNYVPQMPKRVKIFYVSSNCRFLSAELVSLCYTLSSRLLTALWLACLQATQTQRVQTSSRTNIWVVQPIHHCKLIIAMDAVM